MTGTEEGGGRGGVPSGPCYCAVLQGQTDSCIRTSHFRCTQASSPAAAAETGTGIWTRRRMGTEGAAGSHAETVSASATGSGIVSVSGAAARPRAAAG